ncbi:hypothetical protein FH609_014860 [Streptomyces sp. 3MP-14]|uniref:Uncharacterized protein n=1 Tax=Streptomyces mimosae TaxID=2586635 RepID=A0A5N6ABU0_9ACTN|nr:MULTISPECIES: hypothetical protein [Streptomyces]KAB8165702.1 hypothetical protein FH607_012185 [Streptomyces mimosae]KAB8176091.1 hypothetical protein FH609_014860 [Streptomyces sp. 3MP-14]
MQRDDSQRRAVRGAGACARGYRIIHREIGSRGAILKFVRDNVALSITLWCLAALLLTFVIAVGAMVRREARVKRQIVEDFHQQSALDVPPPPPPPPPPYRNPTTPEEN